MPTNPSRNPSHIPWRNPWRLFYTAGSGISSAMTHR